MILHKLYYSFQVEIKKEERQYSGRLQMSVAYSSDSECLAVTLVRAENLQSPARKCKAINPVAFVHLLPHRGYVMLHGSSFICGRQRVAVTRHWMICLVYVSQRLRNVTRLTEDTLGATCL